MDAVVSIATLYLTGTFRRDLTGPAGDDDGIRRHIRRERLDDDEALSVGRDIVAAIFSMRVRECAQSSWV